MLKPAGLSKPQIHEADKAEALLLCMHEDVFARTFIARSSLQGGLVTDRIRFTKAQKSLLHRMQR